MGLVMAAEDTKPEVRDFKIDVDEFLEVDEEVLLEELVVADLEVDVVELGLEENDDEDFLVEEVADVVNLEDSELLDEDDDTPGLTSALRTYTERRSPAPQYSSGLPGQTKLQSVFGAGTDPAENVLPQ